MTSPTEGGFVVMSELGCGPVYQGPWSTASKDRTWRSAGGCTEVLKSWAPGPSPLDSCSQGAFVCAPAGTE